MYKEYNSDILITIRDMVEELNKTNSSKEKQERLSKIYNEALPAEQGWIKWALKNTYSPYIKFGVTSDVIKKYTNCPPRTTTELMSVERLLAMLAKREITGHKALDTIHNVTWHIPINLLETLYNIIDKNLKIRMDAKSINKVIPGLIPEFSVSLCNVYGERKHKVNFEKDNWLCSRKLDGCRCVTIIDGNGVIKFFSRQGKEFLTLDVVRAELKKLNLKNVVLDGEMCIVNENGDEDFKSITKEITRKDHTIQNPKYKVFDMMYFDEFQSQTTNRIFSERYKDLFNLFRKHYVPCIDVVHMEKIESQEQFDEMFNESQSNGWEGLVIRKDDTTICKRSDSMLKCKAFKDEEYIVEGIEVGPFRVIKDGKEVEEEVMANAFITHKGNRVSVGSGWSLEQRRLYKENPNLLIGKTITVQYFEETTDKDGNVSLRFPTCKMVYENGRNI